MDELFHFNNHVLGLITFAREIKLVHQNHDFMDIVAYKKAKAGRLW